MLKSCKDWLSFAHQKKKSIFFYEDQALDLTNFIENHPGGQKAILNYINKDITDIVFTVYPHKKDTTHRILMRYSMGKIPVQQTKKYLKQKAYGDKSLSKEKKHVKVSFGQVSVCNNKQKTDIIQKENEVKMNSKSKPDPPKNSENKKKICKQQQKLKQYSLQNDDIEEEKPAFKIPIMQINNTIKFF